MGSDATLYREFVQSAIGATGKGIVLTGPPGRGKSTYLSALCETLAERVIPTVRHHYFLSTTERGRDRVHSYVVEQSIMAQVKQFHQDVPMAPGACARFWRHALPTTRSWANLSCSCWMALTTSGASTLRTSGCWTA